MKKIQYVCSIAFMLALGSSLSRAQASQIIPVSATGTGTFNGSPSLLIDDFIPPEYTTWNTAPNVWSNNANPNPQYTIDLGSLYQVEDVTVSVDNNDDYVVQYSIDNLAYSDLFTISSSYGNVPVSPGGMDTMTTIAGDPEYVPEIDFTPVEARYLRIFGTQGDRQYGVGEVMAFGQLKSVPEPTSTLSLVALVTLGAASTLKRKLKP